MTIFFYSFLNKEDISRLFIIYISIFFNKYKNNRININKATFIYLFITQYILIYYVEYFLVSNIIIIK